ncbi:hypothetical protein [Acidithiobacillus sp.]
MEHSAGDHTPSAGPDKAMGCLDLPMGYGRSLLYAFPYLSAAGVALTVAFQDWPRGLGLLLGVVLPAYWWQCPLPGARRAADFPVALSPAGPGEFLLHLSDGRTIACVLAVAPLLRPRFGAVKLRSMDGCRYSILAVFPAGHGPWRHWRFRLRAEWDAAGGRASRAA